MKISRYAYTHLTELYELTIDGKYAEDLNKYLKNKIASPIELPDFSPLDICGIFDNHSWSETDYEMDVEFDINAEYDWRGYQDMSFKETVAEMIYDYVNDDLWDSFCDMIDSETTDTEDEVDYNN